MAQPSIIPVDRPLSLIPVGLKEAALDSPSFRSTVVHFNDQIDNVEKWLEGYVKAASKLAQEVGVLEDVVNAFLAASNPPDNLSEAVIDHDYAVLAMRRYGQGAHEFWSHAIGSMTKSQHSVVEPIRATLAKDFRPFKDTRRILEQSQKNYDTVVARYNSQYKSKEASALREDAFQLHEARKAYLKSSMDFCIAAPQLRAALDTLLIKVFSDQFLEMKSLRESTTTMFSGFGHEIARIRNWSQQINQSEALLQRELQTTRKHIEESAEAATRPSRDLEDYTSFSAPTLGARPRANSRMAAEGSSASSKQGWLFMRTITGRPARYTWTRRWFFVKNGVFGWLTQGLKTGGVEESEKIGVLLCNVRAAAQEDRRFCFEVKTKDTVLMLQAETQNELSRWLSVFDVAKKNALEEPVLGTAQLGRLVHYTDAAFAVNPALSPELAEKRNDGQTGGAAEESVLSVSPLDAEPSTVRRNVSDTSRSRRRTLHSEIDSREHASRILSKLDSHRKSIASHVVGHRTGSASLPASPALVPTGNNNSPASASKNSLPASHQTLITDKNKGNFVNAPANTLAPANIASPPLATNLSKTAIMVVAERGLDPGAADPSNGGAPSSLLANQWGSANYGHLSRIERGEVSRVAYKDIASMKEIPSTGPLAIPPTPPKNNEVQAASTPPGPSPGRGHRKTVSDAELSLQPTRSFGGAVDYPPYYPSNLRVHDAQLRLLFPNVPLEQKVLLVFRAAWNPSEHHDLPGRVYITNSDVYFYSHYHGFVLVTGFSLERVADVSAEAQHGHDFIYFALRSLHSKDEVQTITVKVFLEPLQLLTRRLEYIVTAFRSSQTVELEEMISTLINMDNNRLDPSPGLDDWEHVARSRYFDSPTRPAGREMKANLRIDRSLYGGDSAALVDPDSLQFKLPAQPVRYKPQGMTNMAGEGVFNISAKAMFHLLFGDKSAVFQTLLFQRRTQVIKQYPWTSSEGGHWHRRFEYEVTVKQSQEVEKILIVDSQTVDVLNEHLCYVVTDLKTPWHLPRPKDYSLMSRIVITHEAKSKCKLAVFTKIQWHRRSGISDSIIENHALQDLHTDSTNLLSLVTDQVAKLSKSDARTRKAVEIFGHLGLVTEPTQVTSPNIANEVQMIHRTLSELWWTAILSYARSSLTDLTTMIIEVITALSKSFGAHGFLLTLLAISGTIHLLASTAFVQSWYTDHNATSYMSRLGVTPTTTMAKAIYLHDITEITQPSSIAEISAANETSRCSAAFHQLIATIALPETTLDDYTTYTEPSTRSTARRLQKTRQRIATYRHDLLVSLRLVNNIERETMQAEYENWIIEENVKCDQMRTMMTRYGLASSKANAKSQNVEEDDKLIWRKKRLEQLKKVQEGYCGDCRAERSILERRW